MQTVKVSDKDYPEPLGNIPDPPKVLYVIGELPRGRNIAIVGTRKMSSHGQEMAAKITKRFVGAGYIIVSGMALGIDGVAHQTAIDCGGKTIAVLGAGVDVIYPPQHERLYGEIIRHGAVISEVPPGHRVSKELFPARNRIISGLSESVIVIEGALKSGSLITARLALDQGKDVFAVPGSEGTDYLIEQGAGILTE